MARKATKDRARKKGEVWLKKHPEYQQAEKDLHARQQRESRERLAAQAVRSDVTGQSPAETHSCRTIESSSETAHPAPTPCTVEQPTPTAAVAAPQFVTRPVAAATYGASRQSAPTSQCCICGAPGRVRWIINRVGEWTDLGPEDDT